MESSKLPTSWPTDFKQYHLQTSIGTGAFSSVWKARCLENDTEVAIKVMDLENISTSFEDILQEVQTMRLCDDVNVLRCYCSFVHLDQLWLVTQLMDKGSCLRVMNLSKAMGYGEGMNEEWLAYILKEALQGLRYLHDSGQIHRDIKSGNILLDSHGGVRIADFGVSGWTVSRGQRTNVVKTFVGTPCWMAPEVMEQAEGYDNKADIWSIGITALELAKGQAPYARYPPMRVLVLTIEEDPPSIKSYDNDRQRTGAPFSRTFEDFVKKCLCKIPSQRLSASELLKHKFLKSRSEDALVHELLDNISAVGSPNGEVVESMLMAPDEPSNLLTENRGVTPKVNLLDIQPDADQKFAAGTTWVFESGIYGESRGKGGVEEEGIDAFMDGFDQEAATLRSETSGNVLPPPAPSSVVSDLSYAGGIARAGSAPLPTTSATPFASTDTCTPAAPATEAAAGGVPGGTGLEAPVSTIVVSVQEEASSTQDFLDELEEEFGSGNA